jgi:CarD family transcriptional regulator
MYKENDTIMYKAQGLCRIAEVSEKEFAGNRRLYYVLKPLGNDKATIFVPVNDEVTTAKMYPLSSPEEICALIQWEPSLTSLSKFRVFNSKGLIFTPCARLWNEIQRKQR